MSSEKLFTELQIQNSDLPRHRIRDFVKQLIISEQLGSGDAIPSTRMLASLWNVDAAIVHSALSDLVKERLIIRRHGKGTFVGQRQTKLHTIAFYLSMASMSDPTKWFVRSVLVELQELLELRGIETCLWADNRSVGLRDTLLPEWETSIRNKEVQAVMLVECIKENLKFARSVPLPLAAITPENLPFAVSLNAKRLFELSLGRLAEMGCRTAGLITVHPTTEAYKSYYDELVEMAAQKQIQIRNEWIRIPSDLNGYGGFDLARFGYHEFHALWNLKKRPEGLIVEPDIVVEGAMAAILQRGVSVPEELKLVLHRNESHEYICPFPASQIVTSEKDYAINLIKQIDRQIAGEPSAPIRLSHKLIDAVVDVPGHFIPRHKPLA